MPEAEISPKELTPPSERLSDEQLGGLISAVGNHEGKAALLVLMEPDVIYTDSDLHHLLLAGQGENPGWRMTHRVAFDYCRASLAPIGLVTKELLKEGDLQTMGYAKTPYGKKYGDPLSGLLLGFSKDHPSISLSQFFSATQSPSKSSEDIQSKKRAPITRLKIFWELTTANLPIRETDLADRIREDDGIIGRHLLSLAKQGIINYESSSQEVQFKVSPTHSSTQPPVYRTQPDRTRFIYQILTNNPDRTWTAEELASLYIQSNNLRKGADYHGLIKEIGHICSHLVNMGYAEKEKFSGKSRSEITLTTEQRQTLLDLVTLLDAFQRQDPRVTDQGRKLAQHFKTHPQALATLLQKAREKSSIANSTPPEEVAVLIDDILTSQNGLTRQEIQNLLERIGKNLSAHRIGQITKTFGFPFTTKKGLKFFHPRSNSKV